MSNWERPETFTPYDRANLQFEMSLTERLFWAGFAEDLTRLSGPAKFEGHPPKVREAINKQIEEKNRLKLQVISRGSGSGSQVVKIRRRLRCGLVALRRNRRRFGDDRASPLPAMTEHRPPQVP